MNRSINKVRIERAIAALEDAAIFASCLSLVGLALLIAGSSLSRFAFGKSIPDDLVLSGLAVVAIVSFALSYSERKNEHIRVSILTSRFSSIWRKRSHATGQVISAIYYGAFCLLVLVDLPNRMNAYHAGLLDIPIWPMRVVFACGLMLFTVRLLKSAICRENPEEPEGK